MKKRLTLKIYGDVHGVGYRYVSRREAKNRGFGGYVANTDDGVKIVVEGEEKDLQNFADWCYTGVSTANVMNIDQNWSEATGEFSFFVIKR